MHLLPSLLCLSLPLLASSFFSLSSSPNFLPPSSPPLPPSPNLEEASPRMFGLLKKFNPFSLLVINQKHEPNTPEEYCESIGGTYYDPQCLEFVFPKLNFFDARTHCNDRGGDLWVPTKDDLSNPFFFQKLLVGFPKLFISTKGWFYVGITKSGPSGYRGINGVDVSQAPLVRTNDVSDHLCSVLDYEGGNLMFSPKNCDQEESFVCEYVIESLIPKPNKFHHKFWK